MSDIHRHLIIDGTQYAGFYMIFNYGWSIIQTTRWFNLLSLSDFIEHRPIDHNESKRRIFEDSAQSGGQWRPDAYQVRKRKKRRRRNPFAHFMLTHLANRATCLTFCLKNAINTNVIAIKHHHHYYLKRSNQLPPHLALHHSSTLY